MFTIGKYDMGSDDPKLKPFLNENMDLLFIALIPPKQSNKNEHYFSGDQSRFYHLLYKSGLIIEDIDKKVADTIIFGDNKLNYNRSIFGVTDLINTHVETDSNKVTPKRNNVTYLLQTIRQYNPKIVCVIHGKVKDAINKFGGTELNRPLQYGFSGMVLNKCKSIFFVNYFPNGNSIPDETKVQIYNSIKALLNRPTSG